jgi:hypothetical protein
MLFTNLLNRFLGSPGRSPRRHQPRQLSTRPCLVALEDRLVPSTATLHGTTLNIVASPNDTIVLRADPVTPGTLDVSDTPGPLGHFALSSFSNVNVSVAGNDAIKMDDSNGIPFAPGTLVALFGGGAGNTLALFGTQALPGSERYVASTAAGGGVGSVGVGNALFTFTNAVASVTDDLPANQLIVEAPGQAVTLAGPNGLTETLKWLAGPGGGGNTLTFRDKGEVRLELNSARAVASLNAFQSAQGLTNFQVDVFGNEDTVDVNTTPGNVTTQVEVAGQFADVNLAGNSGPVNINGAGTTVVALGTNAADSSESVTSGIRNKVFVEGANALQVLDGGNVTTRETMTVTESSISGAGMFGTNAVVVTYEDVAFLDIETGRLANKYTVAGSRAGAEFGTAISLNDDFSTVGMSVQVSVDSGSGLSLSMFNQNPANGSLSISAPGGTYSPGAPTTPAGSQDILFASGLASVVEYSGFDTVNLS